jgi:septal ring factor EnvC (AmiA/AmiB activator)
MRPRLLWTPISLICLAFATTAATQGIGAGTPSAPVGSTAPTITQTISAVVAELRAHSETLRELVRLQRALLEQRPAPPAKSASDAGQKAYQQALATWTQRVQQGEARIVAQMAKLEETSRRLDALTAKEPPAVMAGDIAAARKAAAAARATAEQALAASKPETAGLKKPVTAAPATGPGLPPSTTKP